MKTEEKYSHNSYWCKNPVQDCIDAGLKAIEFDIIYRMWSEKIKCSHSWKPFDSMYYGNLSDYLTEIFKKNLELKLDGKENQAIKFIIIEPKTFNPFLIKPLYKLLRMYSAVKITSGMDIKFVMSVQRKYPHQWLRGVWLDKFFSRYKAELGILDKRTETNLNNQVDLYGRKWWMF